MRNMVRFLPYKNKNLEKRTYFAIHMVRNLPYDGTYTLQLSINIAVLLNNFINTEKLRKCMISHGRNS